MTNTTTQRRALEALRTELDTVLGAVRDTNPGLTIEVGRCTFSPAGAFTFKLTGTLPGGETREAAQYHNLAQLLALPTVHRDPKTFAETHRTPGQVLPPIYARFLFRGEEYTITGATPRGKVLKRRASNDKVYTWKPEALKHVVLT